MTLQFDLPAMSCGHCVASVKEACAEVDAQAQVNVDLGSKHVTVESDRPREAFAAALAEAGYPPA